MPTAPQAKLRERVTTGISALDQITEGGFLAGKTYLVTGPPGAGKSIFALQFLWSSLKAGRKCVYVCCNQRPADLLANAHSLGWSLTNAYAHKKIAVLDASPYFASFFGRSGGRRPDRDPRKLLADLAKHIRHVEAETLIIDSLNPLLGESTEPDIAAFSRDFIFTAEDYLRCTSVMTLDKPQEPATGTHPVEFYVSGILDLGTIRKNGNFTRTLTIRKARDTAAEVALLGFQIRRTEGISLMSPEADLSPVSGGNNGQKEKECADAAKGAGE